MSELKIKPLTKEQIIISVDRLTRFKETETKYMRVFSELITANLISPAFKKSDVINMDYRHVRDLAEKIINYSLQTMGLKLEDDYVINQRIYDYENSVFDLEEKVQELLKNKINYKAVSSFISSGSVKNLRWLAELSTAHDIREVRRKNGLLFPIEKILLVEGITEETLLPEFAKLCGYDFDQNGVCVISAGGKNQVVKYFYRLVQNCKLPIFVLLDKDASSNYNEIIPKLRPIDSVHLLKAGEFEDILSDELVQKTLDYATKNISLAPEKENLMSASRVEYLQEYFRHRGLHEFKKAEFAELVKQNIADKSDISLEIEEIITELLKLKGAKRLEKSELQ